MFTFLTVGSFRAKGTRTNWQEEQRFAGNCACQAWLISEPFIPACITLKMLLEGQDTTVLSWPVPQALTLGFSGSTMPGWSPVT